MGSTPGPGQVNDNPFPGAPKIEPPPCSSCFLDSDSLKGTVIGIAAPPRAYFGHLRGSMRPSLLWEVGFPAATGNSSSSGPAFSLLPSGEARSFVYARVKGVLVFPSPALTIFHARSRRPPPTPAGGWWYCSLRARTCLSACTHLPGQRVQ